MAKAPQGRRQDHFDTGISQAPNGGDGTRRNILYRPTRQPTGSRRGVHWAILYSYERAPHGYQRLPRAPGSVADQSLALPVPGMSCALRPKWSLWEAARWKFSKERGYQTAGGSRRQLPYDVISCG